MASLTSSQSPLPPSWDPFNQNFTLLSADQTAFNVSIDELDLFNFYNVRIASVFGSEIGACFMLLILLILLTKPDKRGSPIFGLNLLSLALVVIRGILQICYFTGPFSEAYAYFAFDYSRVPTSAYATSIAADVIGLLLLISVQVSLILQVHVVYSTLKKIYRHSIMLFSLAVALLAVGFHFAVIALNARTILRGDSFLPWAWLVKADEITTATSICYFAAVFVVKLGFAIRQRRKLGLNQFGPLQVIFIVGCQTMIIPAVFSCLEFAVWWSGLSSLTLTMVAISLPLSSMWASTSIYGFRQSSGNRQQDNSYSEGSGGSRSTMLEKKRYGPLSPVSVVASTQASRSPMPSPGSPGNILAELDEEAQGLGVRVEKTFTMQSEKK